MPRHITRPATRSRHPSLPAQPYGTHNLNSKENRSCAKLRQIKKEVTMPPARGRGQHLDEPPFNTGTSPAWHQLSPAPGHHQYRPSFPHLMAPPPWLVPYLKDRGQYQIKNPFKEESGCAIRAIPAATETTTGPMGHHRLPPPTGDQLTASARSHLRGPTHT